MKFLGWMRCKFRSSEPLKEFSIGQQSLDDQNYYQKPNYGSKTLREAQRDGHIRKPFSSLEAAREDDNFEEETSAAISELFHGFLTVGTLGSHQIITDPSTPTFTISVKNIAEKETEVTEDLKLINDQLEKVLGSEGKEDGYNDSTGRIDVSTRRSSHGGTVTLGGKPSEGTENSGNGTTNFPLQGYLFGSAIEVPETTVAKKEHRKSLGELFQRAKMAEENSVAKCERGEKRAEKEKDKSAIQVMKKRLKKRILHTSSRSSSTATGGNIDSGSKETKLHKILQMFRRKVYPEGSMVAQKSDKPHKNDIKNITYEGGHNHNNGDRMLGDEDIIIFPHKAISKENTRYSKSSNPPHVILSGSDSNGNREYWIKTDGDYLVLEL